MAESNSSVLEITTNRGDDDVTVTVSGEIDLETSVQFADALADVQDGSRVHLDLAGVDYMDSTGLRVILVAKENVGRAGGVLDITTASAIVTRLLEITGAVDLLSDQPT